MTISTSSALTRLGSTEAPSKKVTRSDQHSSVPAYQDFYVNKQTKAGQSICRTFRLDVYVYDVTRESAQNVSDPVLDTFLSICNGAFSGRQHEHNFGPDKLRYSSNDAFRKDLEYGNGGWVFILYEKLVEDVQKRDILQETMQERWVPAACAKVTKDGTGMDGGAGIHEVVVHPDVLKSDGPQPKTTYWLGALGSAISGAGSVLLTKINTFLSTTVSGGTFLLRAYSVHSWGIGKDWALPESSPLLAWFVRQGFVVHGYSWKPPGTWGCFYGACLGDLRYTHMPQTT